MPENIELAIVGGGPAGLASGLYAARAKLKTLLFEHAMPGGLAARTEIIENYPGYVDAVSGPDLAMNMLKQAQKFGLEIVYAGVLEIQKTGGLFFIKTANSVLKAKAVIIAAGAVPKKLDIKGEEELHGRGVSYCATCDGALYKGKRVAVIGGGDSALKEALFLNRYAEKVTVMHRRGELRAGRHIQEKTMHNGKIDFLWHTVPVEVKGDGSVNAVTVRNVRSGAMEDMAVDGVFIYIGHVPNSGLFKEMVNLDEDGYIITDEEMCSKTKGLFAAGDIREKPLRQVVTAVADGAVAAVSAGRYIQGIK